MDIMQGEDLFHDTCVGMIKATKKLTFRAFVTKDIVERAIAMNKMFSGAYRMHCWRTESELKHKMNKHIMRGWSMLGMCFGKKIQAKCLLIGMFLHANSSSDADVIIGFITDLAKI